MKCERCGCQYTEAWIAPDAIWEIVAHERGAVAGGEGDYNVLCPGCFDELARMKNLVLGWRVDDELKEPPFYNPTLTKLHRKLEAAERRLVECRESLDRACDWLDSAVNEKAARRPTEKEKQLGAGRLESPDGGSIC